MDGHFPMLRQICVAGATCNELHLFMVLDYAQRSSDPVRKSFDKLKKEFKKLTHIVFLLKMFQESKEVTKNVFSNDPFRCYWHVVHDIGRAIQEGCNSFKWTPIYRRMSICKCYSRRNISGLHFIYSVIPKFCLASICVLEFSEKCAYNGHSFPWHSYIATAWWSRFANWYVVWFAEKGFRLNG